MNEKAELYCPDCGEPVDRLVEGYCQECHDERQSELDEFNAQLDWWDGLTDPEKDAQIKRAVRGI